MKALKPDREIEQGDSLAAHLRRRRRELGLFRKQAAQQMGVTEWTLLNWDTAATVPPITFYPRIIAFLGCEPWPEPQTLAEMLLAQRRRNGQTTREAAGRMGIDPTTYCRLEQGDVPKYHHLRDILERFVPGAPLPPLTEEALAYRRRRARER